uniref:Circumsporozoite protein n=1 Tax=Chaetoceros debilis TaxID=122233 RepID=A0A7S3VB36_9STRA
MSTPQSTARSIRILGLFVFLIAAGVGVTLWFTIAPPSFIRNDNGPVSDDGDCEDSVTRTFELNNGEAVNCSWLTDNEGDSKDRIETYCTQPEARYTCTKTCGACDEANEIDIDIESNNTLSPSPTILTCKDSEIYRFDRDNAVTASCAWLTASKADAPIRINKYCPLPEVRYQCAVTCDACGEECADDPSFTFELFSIPGTYKDCTYIQESVETRGEIYCSLFGFSCVESCGYCPPRYTSAPSVSSIPTATQRPSKKPSTIPSQTHSENPSFQPSITLIPSTTPSSPPTLSFIPTLRPSIQPSKSLVPSPTPSAKPSLTLSPSSKPSISPSKSSEPSNNPTKFPSLSPSESPTEFPSHEPSIPPTRSVRPTISSSENPSVKPSSLPTLPPVCLDYSGYNFENDKGNIKDCSWLIPNQTRIDKYCPRPSIMYMCANTCSTCDKECIDDKDYIFELQNNNPGRYRTCDWITSNSNFVDNRRRNYCGLVGKACPHACGYCPPEPSVAPSEFPSDEPTISFRPSISPKPSSSISSKPSLSLEPSFQPSTFPTRYPTSLPSLEPSLMPSVVPSLTPTTMSSSLPSVHPSLAPSASPTSEPSFAPSQEPSTSPFELPSTMPFPQPSLSPSVSPLPSIQPSNLESHIPSTKPSVAPSSIPSLLPSLLPTLKPNMLPSLVPSSTPSSAPSLQPSFLPTLQPSTLPTLIPSSKPSSSSFPSLIPSLEPTSIPSTSPSKSPSILPTNIPSLLPTIAPSVQPSKAPTSGPSSTPTNCPDDSDHTFLLDNGDTEDCAWITISSDPARDAFRINHYCPRLHVRYICAGSCDACDEECADDPSFTFQLIGEPHTIIQDCIWIYNDTTPSTLQYRRDTYCLFVGSACPFACGYCP